MSKIRTLKAEFFRDEDVSPNLVTKLLAAGLICSMADDEGRFKASPGGIRGEIFTHDQVGDQEITEALTHLEETGFVRLYEVNGKRFGLISNWKRHQPVPPTRFVSSTLPPPPSQATRKQGAGTSQAPHKQGASGKERKGIGREKELEGKGENPPTDGFHVPAEPERAEVTELCELVVTLNRERDAKPQTISQAWVTEARLLFDRDGRRPDEALALLEWAARDSFWKSNILGLPKFREKYDTLRLQRERSWNGQANGFGGKAGRDDIPTREELREATERLQAEAAAREQA